VFDTATGPWAVGPEDPTWATPETARHILGELKEGRGTDIPPEWAKVCARRLQKLRTELRDAYAGDNIKAVIDWLLAGLIARENVLLLGAPGVAKSELVVRLFQLLGLCQAQGQMAQGEALEQSSAPRDWWAQREAHERQLQKYFHYQLSRFTQPEELFGPIEISLLRRGILARVNFGMLTGAGVRAAFLDEIFKASPSILNTLLTLSQERQYFNWGGMVPSDLMMLVGASNELPGGFGTASYGGGTSTEDFYTLYAFLDRFPIRLQIEMVTGTSHGRDKVMDSDLVKATNLALAREGRRFAEGDLFPQRSDNMPSISDILLLGRACLQGRGSTQPLLFAKEGLEAFDQAFFDLGAELQAEGTSPLTREIKWSVSPRKLKALYKIALAHALVTDNKFLGDAAVVQPPGAAELRVYDLTWDSLVARPDLQQRTARQQIPRYSVRRP
jgi:MoxR-like ATPase